MRYLLRTVIGLGLMVVAITAMSYAVYQLLQIGTCASGNTPYEIARECPTGTERLILAFPIGLLAMLIGGILYAGRGRAPGSERPPNPGAVFGIVWAGIFLGIALACFLGVWGPDANPGQGGKLGGLIVGFLFVPMGLLGVIPMLSIGKTVGAARQASGIGVGDALKLARGARKMEMSELVEQLQQAQASQTSTAGAAASASATGDRLSELERLNRLRQEGAIDQQEFERLKRGVIGE